MKTMEILLTFLSIQLSFKLNKNIACILKCGILNFVDSIVALHAFDSHIFPIAFVVSGDFCKKLALHFSNVAVLTDSRFSNFLPHTIHIRFCE